MYTLKIVIDLYYEFEMRTPQHLERFVKVSFALPMKLINLLKLSLDDSEFN